MIVSYALILNGEDVLTRIKTNRLGGMDFRAVIGSDRCELCAAFLWLSTATGNQACTWLTMQPVAVSAKCDRQVALRVYSCCQSLQTFYISVCV